ncbi:hypothetical protein [Hyphomonas adhaerens]|uniref:hypothetical protein n=1 Tax=Hyphomonas adhaerens TaxID=81029 RepID=UPI0023543CB3|nr:hypothetical protein [Hyphomonas adhaerens]
MEEETVDIVELGLLAALRLAEDNSWGNITLSAIAEEAGLPLSEFYGVTRDDLANAFEAYFDRAMSAEGPPGGDSPRERLFDVIMLRFEAMEDYRAGAIALMRDRERTPRLLLRLPAHRAASAHWALASAGLDDDSGAPLGLKIAAIAFVIAQTERAWRNDKNGDFALTMAALDKALRAAEARMLRLKKYIPKKSKSGPAEPDDAEEPHEPTRPRHQSP